MNCSSCGFQNRPGVRFCEQCGNQMPQEQTTETTGRFCPNCGQANPLNSKFCSGCGNDLSVIMPAQKSKPSFWVSVGKTTAWVVGSFLLTFLALNIWGIFQTLNPVLEDQTAKAEILAIDFVQENYPELAKADRTAYIANVQGTDYYVVDFVLDDPSRPPAGVRVLVDRLLRAVFTYEHVEG